MNDKTRWQVEDMALVKLRLRAGPFALARPDIDAAPLPGGQAVGAYYSISEKKGGRQTILDSYRVDTIGGLVRMWQNFDSPDCPDCGRRLSLVAFGGSFLSGVGKFADWFCPSCGETFHDDPPCGVSALGDALVAASEGMPLVVPPEKGGATVLPKGLAPADLGGVFDGALLEAYARCAVDALKALDAEAADAARAGRTFHATFRLDAGGGAEGEIAFANVAGFGQLYRAGSDRPVAAIPLEWDEQFGLWPTLHAAANKLIELRAAELGMGKPKARKKRPSAPPFHHTEMPPDCP